MGQGVTGISIVGVCHNRSRELIVSVPGILKVGAAYSPLDAAYPPRAPEPNDGAAYRPQDGRFHKIRCPSWD